MNFQIVPMNLEFARAILEWTYDGPYAVYNYDKSAGHLLDAGKWGSTLFAVLDESGSLTGELTLGFLNAAGDWVPQADMDAGKLDGCILWIGFGMRPNLTGRGLGLDFVNACVDFSARTVRERCRYTGAEIGLRVFQFNQRAVKVYERAGFVTFEEICRIIEGKEYPALLMKKKL